jgi:hypothetical protein
MKKRWIRAFLQRIQKWHNILSVCTGCPPVFVPMTLSLVYSEIGQPPILGLAFMIMGLL